MISFAPILLLLTVPAVFMSSDVHPLSDEFIDAINAMNPSWKAGRNFDISTPWSYLRSLADGVLDIQPEEPVEVRDFQTSGLVDLPENFDARDQWSHCKSLRHIRDQTACGSCWAVAAASAMTDRLCIKSDGNITTSVSAADIMSCCTSCGNGCKGGSIYGPWNYWKQNGVPSGGDYGSNDGCVNYPFPSCATVYWSRKPPCGPLRQTPACKQTCDSNKRTFNREITHGKSVYYLQNEEEIKREILENGPVEGGFTVYEDFYNYISGVYHHVRGKFAGRHAVKLLGWGVENGEKYWLCANSWNEEWGDNGFFKIRRGNNECGIESNVYAGQPLI